MSRYFSNQNLISIFFFCLRKVLSFNCYIGFPVSKPKHLYSCCFDVLHSGWIQVISLERFLRDRVQIHSIKMNCQYLGREMKRSGFQYYSVNDSSFPLWKSIKNADLCKIRIQTGKNFWRLSIIWQSYNSSKVFSCLIEVWI